MKPSTYHIPVLLHPSIEGLSIRKDGIYVDVTLGGGGHSREILSHLSSQGHLYSFDQDEDSIENVGNSLSESDQDRWTLVRSNFRYLRNWMRYYHVEGIHGLLADLGVSSHHFDTAERGFSFRADAPLDMRMNRQAGSTAADIVNTYSEQQLASIFHLYGELKQGHKLAQVLVRERAKQTIATTGQLADILSPLCARDREKKDLARVFQALRIEVNHEMEALQEMLTAATELLLPGGRLAVISYHSLEDRIVKNLMKAGNIEGQMKQDFYGNVEAPLKAIGKPLTPTAEEQAANPRSRSAKLRIAEKL